jgi:hypothetical protein
VFRQLRYNNRRVFRLTGRVTVTSVVPPHAIELLEGTAAELTTATEESPLLELEPELELAPPRVEAATLVPSRASAVKFENP